MPHSWVPAAHTKRERGTMAVADFRNNRATAVVGLRTGATLVAME